MNRPTVVVITGASGGIGSALARGYAGPGVTLGLIGRDGKRLEPIAAQCRAQGAAVEVLVADVTQAEAMRRTLQDFDRQHPIGLLIANAGVNSGRTPDGAPESWAAVQRVFRTNLFGVLHSVTPAVELMRARRRGQIAVVGSLAAWRGLASCPAYSASKAAVETYGTALRGSLAAEGVQVSVISPGYVVSPMSERVIGPKPFLISADRAAAIIRRGLASNRAHIAFPWPLRLATALVAALPAALAEPLLRPFAFRIRPEAVAAADRPGSPADAG